MYSIFITQSVLRKGWKALKSSVGLHKYFMMAIEYRFFDRVQLGDENYAIFPTPSLPRKVESFFQDMKST